MYVRVCMYVCIDFHIYIYIYIHICSISVDICRYMTAATSRLIYVYIDRHRGKDGCTCEGATAAGLIE